MTTQKQLEALAKGRAKMCANAKKKQTAGLVVKGRAIAKNEAGAVKSH